jgi:hypothetical protein
VPGEAAGEAAGEADGAGVLVGDGLAGGVLAAAVGVLTATVSAAVGSTVMAGLVTASAVAVRVTDVIDVTSDATGICACIWSDDGASAVAIDPIVQVAEPSPLGQRPVKDGSSPCGAAVSVTETPAAAPFAAQTCTVYDAAWPAVMLDWEVWTLTHNSAWVVEAVGDGVAAADSGSHCELVAASAPPEVVSADAAGIRLQARREPPDRRQAASARQGASRIRTAPPRDSRRSLTSGACGNPCQAGQGLVPPSVQATRGAYQQDPHIPDS